MGTDRRRQSKHQLYTGLTILGKSPPNAVNQYSYIRVRQREREREIKIGREKKRDTRRNRERKRAQEREKVRQMRERELELQLENFILQGLQFSQKPNNESLLSY